MTSSFVKPASPGRYFQQNPILDPKLSRDQNCQLERHPFLVSFLPLHAHYMRVSQIRKYCSVPWIHDKFFFIQINLCRLHYFPVNFPVIVIIRFLKAQLYLRDTKLQWALNHSCQSSGKMLSWIPSGYRPICATKWWWRSSLFVAVHPCWFTGRNTVIILPCLHFYHNM